MSSLSCASSNSTSPSRHAIPRCAAPRHTMHGCGQNFNEAKFAADFFNDPAVQQQAPVVSLLHCHAHTLVVVAVVTVVAAAAAAAAAAVAWQDLG